MDQLGLQRRGEQVSYQIFPDPEEQQDQDEDPAQVRSSVARLKGRLPSIVVEPSEESEEEAQQWFPRSQTSIEEQEQEQEPEEELELFQDQCEPSRGGQDEHREVDGVPHFKRSSIPGIEIDYNRLTPPPLLTSSHAAPPCLRS